MPRNLYCNVLGSSPNVQNLVSKIFAKYCKRLVSKVSCLVSVLERSSLGLVSSFCLKSRSRNVNVSSRSGSRRFWSRLQLCFEAIWIIKLLKFRSYVKKIKLSLPYLLHVKSKTLFNARIYTLKILSVLFKKKQQFFKTMFSRISKHNDWNV